MRVLLPLLAVNLWTAVAVAAPQDGAVGGTAEPSAVDGTSATAAPAEAPPAREENCSDGVDNDGDTVFDCGDADCAKTDACKADGRPENTAERCGDWIDNDNDGATDCDDLECERTSACRGSWKGPLSGTGDARPSGPAGEEPGDDGEPSRLGYEVEGADSDDGVGFAGVRFGVVASAVQSYELTNANNVDKFDGTLDTRFNALQLRAFGNLPYLEDSFFLISVRGDGSPRLTFAMFQLPIWGGHYINFNSGGGTLSQQPIISFAKLPLLERAFYVNNAFEQPTSAGVEVHGPILPGWLRYRVFAAGGAGVTGVLGGRRITFDNFNYTYSVGGQLQFTPIGYFSRFESPFLYRPVPMALSFFLGGRYDQRLQERFPAGHGQAVFRWGIFELYAEGYTKYELNFGSLQASYNVMAGLLLWPEWFFFAADFGQYIAGDFERLPDELETDLRRQRSEMQARAALHYYFWRSNGVLSLRYAYRSLAPPKVGPDVDRAAPIDSHEIWMAAQLRF